jgi:hypothetical protein
MRRLLVIILSFLIAPCVLAISGACSDHNGVNCYRESSNGYAVCNDGFISSTLYSQTDECKINCVLPIATCSQQQISQLQSAEQSALSSANASALANGLMGSNVSMGQSQSVRSYYDQLILQCTNEMADYQTQMLNYNFCLSNKAKMGQTSTTQQQSCGYRSHFDSLANQCVCDNGYYFDSNTNFCVTGDLWCITNYAKDSTYNTTDKKCECSDGYIAKDSTCITYTNYCKAYYGDNAYGAKGDNNNPNCYCVNGYEYSSDLKKCVVKIQPIIVSNGSNSTLQGLDIVKPVVSVNYAVFSTSYNVRQTASMKGKILTTAKKNVKYKILDLSNKDWIKIEVNKKVGWVVRKYAKIVQ